MLLTLAPTLAESDPRPSGGIQIIQTASATTPDGSAGLTVNFPVPLTAGSQLFAFISWDTESVLVNAHLVDGGATPLSSVVVSEAGTSLFDAAIYSTIENDPVTGGETGITVTFSASFRADLQVIEVAGLADAAAEDTASIADNSGLGGQAGLPAFSNTTPTALAVAIGAWNTNAYISGPNAGWTRIGTGTGGASVWQEAAYKIVAAAGEQTANWDLGAGADYALAGAVFGGT